MLIANRNQETKMQYSEFSKTFLTVLNEIRSKKVAVLGHMNPDGDCIGSQIGLCRILNALGIESVAINKDPIPHNLAPFVADTPFATPKKLPFEADVSIYLDCGELTRAGAPLFELFPKPLLNIDHHLSNPEFAKYNIVHTQSAATSEILAKIAIENKLPLDTVTAQAFYVGIATDTLQFRSPSTNQEVFSICAKLIECGAQADVASFHLYESEPLRKFLLLRLFLDTLKIEFKGKICIGVLNDAMYNEVHAKPLDSDGFVDYTRTIENVEIGALIEEHHGNIKGSLRAKRPEMRVDILASNFKGGGHACASGFSVQKESLDTFYPRFLSAVELHLKQYSI